MFCGARHDRFRESDVLRRVFEGVVATCIAAGLVGGEAFSIDASLIKADVDKKKRLCGDQLPGRRVRKHRMRFGNTSLLSMLPAAKMRAIAVGMAERRIAASVEASRPSKFH